MPGPNGSLTNNSMHCFASPGYKLAFKLVAVRELNQHVTRETIYISTTERNKYSVGNVRDPNLSRFDRLAPVVGATGAGDVKPLV